jgi:hypothetical protein
MQGISEIIEVMKDAKAKSTSELFIKSHIRLSQARQAAREEMQKVTSEKVKAIISKMLGDSILSSQDIECIRMWIVGDADGYMAMENDYQSWLLEYDRLTQVLSSYSNKSCSSEELLKLQGILEDALRLAADIGNYLEKKERITKFETAISDQASLDKGVLRQILETKLSSPEL